MERAPIARGKGAPCLLAVFAEGRTVMVEDGFDEGLCAKREAIRKVSDAQPKQFMDGHVSALLEHLL